jgi:hypothetical protein
VGGKYEMMRSTIRERYGAGCAYSPSGVRPLLDHGVDKPLGVPYALEVASRSQSARGQYMSNAHVKMWVPWT